MATKKSRKGKGQYALYKAESRLEKNKRAKLAKHIKKHPNDAQAASKVKSPISVRKAPLGGSAPAMKEYWYDGAGRKNPMPEFKPYVKGGK